MLAGATDGWRLELMAGATTKLDGIFVWAKGCEHLLIIFFAKLFYKHLIWYEA
jgi:hypothetical protein